MQQYKYKSTNDWRPVAGENIVARVLGKDVVDVSGKPRAYLLVDTGTAIWRVFELAGLADVFASAARGDYVDLTYLGSAQLKNGNTFKRFRSAVFTLDDSDDGAIALSDAPKRTRPAATKSKRVGHAKAAK